MNVGRSVGAVPVGMTVSVSTVGRAVTVTVASAVPVPSGVTRMIGVPLRVREDVRQGVQETASVGVLLAIGLDHGDRVLKALDVLRPRRVLEDPGDRRVAVVG
jgi:hypothetical protein